MVAVIRKQLYIKPHQDVLLKKKAKASGLTEAELIRRAIETHLKTNFELHKYPLAWETEKQFILSRIRPGKQAQKRGWSRDELYDR